MAGTKVTTHEQNVAKYHEFIDTLIAKLTEVKQYIHQKDAADPSAASSKRKDRVEHISEAIKQLKEQKSCEYVTDLESNVGGILKRLNNWHNNQDRTSSHLDACLNGGTPFKLSSWFKKSEVTAEEKKNVGLLKEFEDFSAKISASEERRNRQSY